MAETQPLILQTDELDYELPERFIATRPAEPRDAARMMVLHRSSNSIDHRHVHDLPEYLNRNDALVFNTTAVLPARLLGHRVDTGGKVEGLYLHEEPSSSPASNIRWRLMLKAGGKLRPGQRIHFHGPVHSAIELELVQPIEAEWIAQLPTGSATVPALHAIGWTPLPPYILHARHNQPFNDEDDRRWYQTTYAQSNQAQSVAAPTAGLHFTPQLLESLHTKGVQRIDITLHVGPGTFKPITAPTLAQHKMHSEFFEVPIQSIANLYQLRRSTGPPRIIAVGTTTVRTLESLPDPLPNPAEMCGPLTGLTDLMIAPPYRFKHVDGMLTNFHLPRSTLLALVAAMIGLDRLKAAYREAMQHGYRFYSYGDAMLLLP